MVRALADDENPARPSPLVARTTSDSLVHARLEQLRHDSAASIVTAEAHVNTFNQLSERSNTLERERTDTIARRDSLDRLIQEEAARE